MTTFVALLRAINVGGTGKITMPELCRVCEKAGFRGVRTYIQSGNLVLRSALSELEIKAKLERALAAKLGKPFSAFVRSEAQLRAALENNPFPTAAPNRLLIAFLDVPPPRDALDTVAIPADEQIEIRGREVFIHYPNGMGTSKLKLPFADVGTRRNLNTVKKLLELASELGE